MRPERHRLDRIPLGAEHACDQTFRYGTDSRVTLTWVKHVADSQKTPSSTNTLFLPLQTHEVEHRSPLDHAPVELERTDQSDLLLDREKALEGRQPRSRGHRHCERGRGTGATGVVARCEQRVLHTSDFRERSNVVVVNDECRQAACEESVLVKQR